MISCDLQGGLGNQMFQIAATHALALRNNDTSGFNFAACNTPMQGNPSTKYRSDILFKVNDSNGHVFKVRYTEPRFGYDELPYGPDFILRGYFQSEKYFIDFKKEILELFTISNKHIADSFLYHIDILGKPVTSVHVRRGDYLKNSDFHPTCSIEYYKKAMEIVGDSNFIFISDDMPWVKENFKGDNIFYSENHDELTDFAIMTLTEHNIIANSSFSWWGAYMNQIESIHRNQSFPIDKKVIAPKKWFGPKGPSDTQDIIPSNWSIIDI